MLKYPTDVRVEHDLAIADIDRADDALHTYAPLHDGRECDEAGMGHARLGFVGCRP